MLGCIQLYQIKTTYPHCGWAVQVTIRSFYKGLPLLLWSCIYFKICHQKQGEEQRRHLNLRFDELKQSISVSFNAFNVIWKGNSVSFDKAWATDCLSKLSFQGCSEKHQQDESCHAITEIPLCNMSMCFWCFDCFSKCCWIFEWVNQRLQLKKVCSL